MKKFVAGKTSITFLLFLAVLVASFFLGKSLTSIKATCGDGWTNVGGCVAPCDSSAGKQNQQRTVTTRVCDTSCPNYTFSTSHKVVDAAGYYQYTNKIEDVGGHWGEWQDGHKHGGGTVEEQKVSDAVWHHMHCAPFYGCTGWHSGSDSSATYNEKVSDEVWRHHHWVETTYKCPAGYENNPGHDNCRKWIPEVSHTENYSKTFTYEKSSDPNKCHKPTPDTLEIPTWARPDYGSRVPEWQFAIETNCHNETSTETRQIDCVATVVACSSSCGNNEVETGEQCDDGNIMNGDGCSSTCQTETSPVCGNGIVETGEQCDDGNSVDTDECPTNCMLEEPNPTPTPNPDLCMNIDGIQYAVPDGLHINATGVECVAYGTPGVEQPSSSSTGEVLGTSTASSAQVLGASTMAGTGSFNQMAYQAIMVIGGTLSALGIKNFKKASKKA